MTCIHECHRIEDEERRAAEACASLSLFSSRVEEGSSRLSAARDQLISHLSGVQNTLAVAIPLRQAALAHSHHTMQHAEALQRSHSAMQQAEHQLETVTKQLEKATVTCQQACEQHSQAIAKAMSFKCVCEETARICDETFDALRAVSMPEVMSPIPPSLPPISTIQQRQQTVKSLYQNLCAAGETVCSVCMECTDLLQCGTAATKLHSLLQEFVQHAQGLPSPTLAHEAAAILHCVLVSTTFVSANSLHDLQAALSAEDRVQRDQSMQSQLMQLIANVRQTQTIALQQQNAVDINSLQQAMDSAEYDLKNIVKEMRRGNADIVHQAHAQLFTRIKDAIEALRDVPSSIFSEAIRLLKSSVTLAQTYTGMFDNRGYDCVFNEYVDCITLGQSSITPIVQTISSFAAPVSALSKFISQFSRVAVTELAAQKSRDSVALNIVKLKPLLQQALDPTVEFAYLQSTFKQITISPPGIPSENILAAQLQLSAFAGLFVNIEQEIGALHHRLRTAAPAVLPRIPAPQLQRALFRCKLSFMIAILETCLRANGSLHDAALWCAESVQVFTNDVLCNVLLPITHAAIDALIIAINARPQHQTKHRKTPVDERFTTALQRYCEASELFALRSDESAEFATVVAGCDTQLTYLDTQLKRQQWLSWSSANHRQERSESLRQLSEGITEFIQHIDHFHKVNQELTELEDAIAAEVPRKQHNFVKRTATQRREVTDVAITNYSQPAKTATGILLCMSYLEPCKSYTELSNNLIFHLQELMTSGEHLLTTRFDLIWLLLM